MKKNILLGVTASVAIYKSCSLVRILQRQGYGVKVIMSPNATKLISPKLFESLTNQRVYVEMLEETQDYSIEHIGLAKWANLVIIAPASANTIAKLAAGICDNLLTTAVLALPQSTPVVVACAMNTHMWNNPVTKKNIDYLKTLKNYKLVLPAKGRLASGDRGEGVLSPLEDIVQAVKSCLKK